jgi:CDP-4-dehydro-6-deoxyglucose reductase
MPKIFLNNGKWFDCDENDTIISAAQKNGIFLDHSCLSGRCSSCRYKVKQGETVAIQDEISLDTKEKSENIILACIRKPLSDVHLDAEDLSEYGLETSKIVPAKVVDIAKLTSTIIKVTFRLPPTQKINFVEGQYVDLVRGGIKRSYSIACNSDSEVVELIIKYYTGGVMSDYWFSEAKTNHLLIIEGPKGTFFLRNHESKDNLVLIATGTGIAPIKSIVESKLFDIRTRGFKKIYLLWGMPYENDIFWKPTNSRITFIPVLSKEFEKKQYVQSVLNDLQIPVDKSVYYACGSDSLIHDLKNILMRAGLSEKSFFYDAFLPSN